MLHPLFHEMSACGTYFDTGNDKLVSQILDIQLLVCCQEAEHKIGKI